MSDDRVRFEITDSMLIAAAIEAQGLGAPTVPEVRAMVLHALVGQVERMYWGLTFCTSELIPGIRCWLPLPHSAGEHQGRAPEGARVTWTG